MLFGSRLNKLAASIKKLLSGYAVASKEPELVFDFASDYYRTSGSDATFADSITHARASNATMVDSDGLLKWGPHNLLLRSEEFDSTWSPVQTTVDPDTVASPNGAVTADTLFENTASTPHYLRQTVLSLPTAKHTYKIWLKKPVASGVDYAMVTLSPSSNGFSAGYAGIMIDFSDGSVVAKNSTLVASDISSQPYADGWFLVSFDVNVTASTMYAFVYTANAASDTPVTSYLGSNRGVHIWGAHLYRSDLGGMVDNPDRGDSYVPTTTSARYLPRRGHHVYNGSAWVNEGLLVESEERTNLVEYSQSITGYAAASVTLSNNETTSPSGVFDANMVTSDSAATPHGFGTKAINFTLGITYCSSFFLKGGTEKWVQVTTTSAQSNTSWANFDLENGVVGNTGADVNAFIEPYGNEWYRCSIVYTTASSLSNYATVCYFLNNTDSATRAPTFTNAGLTFYFYQEDVEVGSTPSSPIPTSGSTVTRAADTLTVPSANLPWPEPVVIGEELVTNGTFDTDTDWTLTDATISGGVLTSDAATGVAVQDPGFVIGKAYLVEYEIIGRTAGDVDIGIGSYDQGLNLTESGSFIQVCINDTNGLLIRMQNSFDGSIDNISVKEINPLSVSIQMDGRMTYADNDAAAELILLQWRPDGNNEITSRVSTNGVDTGRIQFLQRNAGTLDLVAETSPGSYSPSILVPYNIASRHGSTFINGAADGVALTENDTPTALPDLSTTDLELAPDYMGTIKTFRVWDEDLADEGIEEATAPSLEPSLSLIFDSTESSFIVEDWT